jgi:hypothetical protein
LQRWIFPKKLLIFLCFVFLLPSTLSRCITLPENAITAKGRKARVRFSTTDCSIQKINVPLRLQEKSAGLIPLKFKVYEYGTKPEEYTTSTSEHPTAISQTSPGSEDPVEPTSPLVTDPDGKGPLPATTTTTKTTANDDENDNNNADSNSNGNIDGNVNGLNTGTATNDNDDGNNNSDDVDNF